MNRDRYLKVLKTTVLALILSVFIFGAGFLFGQSSPKNAGARDFDISQLFNGKEVDFSLVKDVWDAIHVEYVNTDNIDDKALIFAAIRGMLDELGDPYSVFFDKQETEQFLSSVTGKFEGVGIEITIRDKKLVVIAPLKDSPAIRAGVRAGDIITAIDGEATEGITLEGAVSKIRGTKGTVVVLTVARENGNIEEDISIIRDTIKVPTVEWEIIEGNIAYIEIVQFSENTDTDFQKIAQEILASPADRIILDLRNNPGGFLESAVNISGWFLPEGAVAVTEEKGGKQIKVYRSPGPALLRNFPVVVLQNEGSASASEIIAGALRDQREAPIVGEKSFGKGSVQSFKDLAGGTSLKITVARWVTPSGQYINDKGIEPTIKVEISEEDIEAQNDSQRQKAIELIKFMR